jgi:plasmid replication initiation protein
LDSKQRKIRSLRGFFLYALQIIDNGKDYEILETNLQPFFWRKVKNIIRQNKKEVLLQFLFGRVYSYQDSTPHSDIIEMIQNLQTQVNSLQQKIIELEKNQSLNSLSGTRMDEKTFFETPIGNSSSKRRLKMPKR